MRPDNRSVAYWVFLILFGLLLLFLWYDIESPQYPRTIAKLDVPVPEFHLVDLLHSDKFFTSDDLRGQVVLLNIWASWCYPCRIEHPVLLNIARNFHIPIYSLNYQDGSDAADAWLKKNGNPFVKVGMDNSGMASQRFGVYGTPETFLIDKEGVVRYQHIGVLTESEWRNVLWPLVQECKNQKVAK